MHRGRAVLAATLILLFLGLSFNAYACLLPAIGVTTAAMGNGCSTPEEPPVRQFCDAFKTLSVESAVELHQTFDCQTICSEDTASLLLLLNLASPGGRFSDHPADSPPHDLLLEISVLRI